MKSCSHCGCENADDDANCQMCGRSLSQPYTALPYILRPWIKWVLYSGAWGAVVVATLVWNPSYLLTAPGFPIGLLAVLPGEKMTIAAWFAGPIVIGVGWIVYGVLTYVMKTTRKSGIFFLAYIIFCILLALNMAGCKAVTATVGGIH